MDPRKDLEEFKRTCKMVGDYTEEEMKDKEIVIRDLDICRFHLDQISVKELDDKSRPVIVNVEGQEEGECQKIKIPVKVKDQKEFSKDKDIPQDMTENKPVYDFVMSKERTLPQRFTRADIQALNKNWLCIATLGLSTLLVLIIVIIVLLTSE